MQNLLDFSFTMENKFCTIMIALKTKRQVGF
nr:MAG TPA: hypothetical protein [Caudoviricetes sp.]